MSRLNVSVAHYNGRGSCAQIEDDDDNVMTISCGMSLSAKEACVSAANQLRVAADRFDKLAKCDNPYNSDTHDTVNRARMSGGEVDVLRMQLAGCGVAAMCNTEQSIKEQRISPDNPYWSASYGDVCRAVDREMIYREALQKLACLGNGDQHGNSDGNCIAIDVLRCASEVQP